MGSNEAFHLSLFLVTLEATTTRQVPRKHWGVTKLLLVNQRCLTTKLGWKLFLFLSLDQPDWVTCTQQFKIQYFILASFRFCPQRFCPMTAGISIISTQASSLEKSLTLTAQSEGCPVFKNSLDIKNRTAWWFQILFSPLFIWGRFPFWLIFFKGVETTN